MELTSLPCISLFHLPLEIQAHVFEHLPLHDLAAVSLVCRTWRDLAFPYLHRTMHIFSDSDLAELSSRVAVDDERGPYSIVKHIRGLCLVRYRRRVAPITRDGLRHLEVLVPRLVKLKFLYSDVWHIRKYLKLFQTHCTSLDNIDFTIQNGGTRRVFNFSNLSHISIKFTSFTIRASERYFDYLLPLTQLLASSPGLISLTLKNHSPQIMPIVNIISLLGDNWVFPHLRVFRILGFEEYYVPEIDNSSWDDFFTLPNRDSHPLRSFFLRHGGISDLALGWSSGTSYQGEIDPNEIVELFPNLKHFEGPGFLCNAIAKSDLARDLEAMIMLDETFVHNVKWLDVMADGLRSMPKLRSLRINTMGQHEALDPRVLEAFMLAAPGIEHFQCCLPGIDFDRTLCALSHASRLRELLVDGQTWLASALNRESEDRSSYGDWKAMISRIADRCRSLELFEPSDGTCAWRIVRDKEGDFSDIVNAD